MQSIKKVRALVQSLIDECLDCMDTGMCHDGLDSPAAKALMAGLFPPDEELSVTGYQMLIAARNAAHDRKTAISLTNIQGDGWVVTETNPQTGAPRQLGKFEFGLFEALQSCGDFNTTYKS